MSCSNKYQFYIGLLLGIVLSFSTKAQKTIVYDIATETESKLVFLFNTSLQLDSAPIFNKKKRALTADEAYQTEYYHNDSRFIPLFEADGSALLIDTGGYLFTRDNDNFEAKPKPLNINIDTLGAGKKNLIIEVSSRDLENLKIFVIPYTKYYLSSGDPNVKSQLSLKLEEIIYGAKNKVPPRLLDLWKEQVSFVPADRKVLYNFSVVLPPSMAHREGNKILMIYDLSHQVVAIFPDLNKTENILYRENIISKTYIYKLYFNEEEVKKGFIHFLSPEDEEKKRLELENPKPNPDQESEPEGEKKED